MRLFFEPPFTLSDTICVENAADFLCAVAGCKASAINRATKLGQPR